MSIQETAQEYLKYQLSIVLIAGENSRGLDPKKPIHYWDSLQEKALTAQELETLFKKGSIRPEIEHKVSPKDKPSYISKGIKLWGEPQSIGIITGAISGGLEVIDVDTKQDNTGSLWDEFRSLIQDNPPGLYDSLVIAQTQSGGYHIYYRCSQIGGNIKLASKPTRETLIETRGEGGYVVAPPTAKYSYLQGTPEKIPTITPEQRAILLNIARSFNQLSEEKPKIKATTSAPSSPTGLSPWEDYNNRGDIIALLKGRGWRIVSQSGERINLLRPGETASKTSGNYHTRLKTLRIWSTSTEFSSDKAYSPAQVFSLLECGEDSKLTYRRLLELGYGEPYKGDQPTPTQVKTERIRVEVINSVNRETSVISSPGDSLKIESLQTATGEEVVITSPGEEATDEVLKAIALIEETGKRIYIKEAQEPEVRSYQYTLQAILNKYGALQETRGGLTERDIESLLDEVVKTATRIKEPMDRDRYKKLFTSLEFIQELGITQESYQITVDRLTSTQETQAQERAFTSLLSEISKLPTDKALDKLETSLSDIKAITGKGLLPPPGNFATLLEDIASTPLSYKTGYSSLDKFVGFTPGAITLIAGRPSHGKTTLLFNLLLEMSKLYKDESFYFFTYEEPTRNLSIKLLNRLTATDLSGYYYEYPDLTKNTNYEYLKAYIKAKRTDIAQIEEGKRLLGELVDSQRIKVIDKGYSVEELSSLIAYLTKGERIGAIFIDYIQRMRTNKEGKDIRTEIVHISDQVLQIAKQSGLPVILGSQLNRATLSGGIKKPTLENLKESGNLEEDANTVLSVYNESREREETEGGESYKGLREVELEIKALKNREGEVNQVVSLLFDKWTGVIKDK